MELHASLWNIMKDYGTACNLMELHASSWTCMKAHGTAYKLMELHVCRELHASWCNSLEPKGTLGNSEWWRTRLKAPSGCFSSWLSLIPHTQREQLNHLHHFHLIWTHKPTQLHSQIKYRLAAHAQLGHFTFWRNYPHKYNIEITTWIHIDRLVELCLLSWKAGLPGLRHNEASWVQAYWARQMRSFKLQQ